MFVGPTAILLAAAIIPAVYLLIQVYKQDKLEKESPQLLFRLVLQGIFATFGAILTETIGDAVMDGVAGGSKGLLYHLIYFMIVVALSEEGFKYILLKKVTWNSPEFNCQFDGVIYAAFVGLGFALWENISYVFSYGLTVAVVRAVTAVPAHCCFGIFMGVYYGLAKRAHNYGQMSLSAYYRKLAVIMPVIMHGLYDFLATVDGSSVIFIIFVIAMFAHCHRLIKKMSDGDNYFNNGGPGAGGNGDSDYYFYV